MYGFSIEATRFILAFLILVGTIISTYAQTGECEGIVRSYTSGGALTFSPIRGGTLSTWSNTVPYGPNTTLTVPENTALLSQTVGLVDGFLVNLETLRNATSPNKRMYIHSNSGWTQIFHVSNNAGFYEGQITAVNTSAVTIRFTIKNSLGAATNNPGPLDSTITIPFQTGMVFKYEGKLVSASEALVVGRHLRFYPARNQTVYGFSPAALDPQRESRPSGGNNHFSWVTEGFLHGYDTENSYYAEFRKGRWVNSYKSGAAITQGQLVEGHFINSPGAAGRQGDKVIYIPYTFPGDGRTTRTTIFRPQDDESVEGYVLSRTGNDVRLRITVCPTGLARDVRVFDSTITLQANARLLLNGNDVSGSQDPFSVGNYVRIAAAWDGAMLVRDIDLAKMQVTTPVVAPQFVSDFKPELINANQLWQQPQELLVHEGKRILLPVVAHGRGELRYTWFKEGNLIRGANTANYFRTATLADNNAQFTCVVTNAQGADTSLPIRLIVIPNQQRPLPLAISIEDINTLRVSFNKPLARGNSGSGAQNPSHYTLSGGGGAITSAHLLHSDSILILKVSGMQTGLDYELVMNNLACGSENPISIEPNTRIAFSTKPKFRYFGLWIKNQVTASDHRIDEVRYLVNGVEYGPNRTYWARSCSHEAFDNDSRTYCPTYPNSIIGLDMGANEEILPDTVLLKMGRFPNRHGRGIVVRASHNRVAGPWHVLYETDDDVYLQGETYLLPTNTTNIDPATLYPGGRQLQDLIFPTPDPQPVGTTYLANAVTTSNLPIVYRVISGPAIQVNNSTFRFTDVGEVVLEAFQGGNATFYPALTQYVTINVTGEAIAYPLRNVSISPRQNVIIDSLSNRQFFAVALDPTGFAYTGPVTYRWSVSAPNLVDAQGRVTPQQPYRNPNYVFVEAEDALGNVVRDSVVFNIPGIVSGLTSSTSIWNVALVYPNPAKGIVNILTSEGSVIHSITLLDLTGKVVYNQSYDSPQVSLKQLSKGLYFLKLETNKGTFSQRLVLER